MMNKGGQNPPVPTTHRPPNPKGSCGGGDPENLADYRNRLLSEAKALSRSSVIMANAQQLRAAGMPESLVWLGAAVSAVKAFQKLTKAYNNAGFRNA
jgi:hypothetical protein